MRSDRPHIPSAFCAARKKLLPVTPGVPIGDSTFAKQRCESLRPRGRWRAQCLHGSRMGAFALYSAPCVLSHGSLRDHAAARSRKFCGAQNSWGISSAGRATGLQPVGQRFDPAILHQSSFLIGDQEAAEGSAWCAGCATACLRSKRAKACTVVARAFAPFASQKELSQYTSAPELTWSAFWTKSKKLWGR